MRHTWTVFTLLVLALPLLSSAASPPADYAARVARILEKTPLIDGHNDLPWEIRERYQGKVSKLNLRGDTAALPIVGDSVPLMTDIPRLRRGLVGGLFWSVYIPVEVQGAQAVQMTIEQIDIVRQMTERYPEDLELAFTAADIRRIHQSHRIASLIGIEGGHQINDSLAVLRQMYVLGARYMTLTHVSNTDWADAATDNPKHRGLTPFGRAVVREMNRLGMLVDLSHVSPDTMRAALETSAAPVIFSHSAARALVDHSRNVPDDILRLLASNGGVVMVNFYPGYVLAARYHWDADDAAERARYSNPPYAGLYVGQPERAKAAIDLWERVHPAPQASLTDVADHIDHVRQVAGIDHVGVGSDFDGIPVAPQGLEAVDQYPALLIELLRRGWSDTDVAKLAGENVLRVLAAAERVGARLRASTTASEATLAELDGDTQTRPR